MDDDLSVRSMGNIHRSSHHQTPNLELKFIQDIVQNIQNQSDQDISSIETIHHWQIYGSASNIIVAAGSIGTPSILRSSGLESNNEHTGLHIHPVINTWGSFRN